MYNDVESPKNNPIHEKSETTLDKSTVHENTDSAITNTTHEDTIPIYDRIANVLDKIFNLKNMFRYTFVFFIIFLTISCIKVTKDNQWEKLLTYPEEAYTNLEKEANKIAETHNFESIYKFSDIQYDYYSKTLSFKLYDEINSATITVNIYNYNLKDQYLDTIRTETSELLHKIINISLIVIFFPLILTGALITLICILALLISFIAFCISQKNSNNEKNSKKND